MRAPRKDARRKPVREPWRSLRVGERVRVVRLPSGIDAPGYVFPRETRHLYLRLIAGRRSHRIAEIDEWGLPWIHTKQRDRRYGWIYHWLALNDDSWVRVRHRVARRSQG
jgi:hypothetical protein